MIALFQILVLLFIFVSFLLVISVPVVFAYPNGWADKNKKNTLFSGLALWFFLLFIVGILNSFVL
uniref:Photosystem II reaction center protein Z n=1 Tax=Codium simulans TaxID=589376 RepID=A0A1I9LKG2_9CHLO|nr:photosystem II reaction center protein Z [Codium simulans]ANJ70823.1 photosystem II reaction center protein Z [Codium simulans]